MRSWTQENFRGSLGFHTFQQEATVGFGISRKWAQPMQQISSIFAQIYLDLCMSPGKKLLNTFTFKEDNKLFIGIVHRHCRCLRPFLLSFFGRLHAILWYHNTSTVREGFQVFLAQGFLGFAAEVRGVFSNFNLSSTSGEQPKATITSCMFV